MSGSSAEKPPGPASSHHVGLLTQVMTNTLDADYATVAARRRHAPAAKSGAVSGATVVAVLVAFGLLVGVSALTTEQDQPKVAAERAELVEQVRYRQGRVDSLYGDLAALQTRVAGLQGELTTAIARDTQLRGRLEVLAVAAGTVAVTGPGIAITADDAEGASGDAEGVILDSDLQAVVNGLWLAGAEAIAIDGHRLTTLTAIRFAGQAITVDYRSLTPPYLIEAVGDPKTLAAQFLQTPAGQRMLGLRNNFGIAFDMVTKQSMTLPSDPHEQLRHAERGSDR